MGTFQQALSTAGLAPFGASVARKKLSDNAEDRAIRNDNMNSKTNLNNARANREQLMYEISLQKMTDKASLQKTQKENSKAYIKNRSNNINNMIKLLEGDNG